MSHSPEPWSTERRGETCYVLSGDKIILTVKDGAIYGGQYLDAERLVSCVNACCGIPTELLEANIIFQFVEQAKNYKRYLDTDGMTLCRLNEVAIATANAMEKSP